MGSSSTANIARKPLVQKAPVKASSQKGAASLAGSSRKATASTNITSSPLAEAAARPANRWRSPSDREPFTSRPQAWGRPEPRALGASLIRFLSLRLKPKAAAAPNSGRGPGTAGAV